MNRQSPGRSAIPFRFASICWHNPSNARNDRCDQPSVFMWYGSSAMYGWWRSPNRTGRFTGLSSHDWMSAKLRARSRSSVGSPVDCEAFSGRWELSGIWVNSGSKSASTSSADQSRSAASHATVSTWSGFFRHISAT